ncbi:MAG: hypothetical protein ACRCUE_03605 [Bosea sp. (in: a-proteobacteria)]
MTSWLIESIGFLAAGATAVTFYCKRMAYLRAFAIGANVLFITYGAAMGLMPVLVLHCLLLPLNIMRLAEAIARHRRERAAEKATQQPTLAHDLKG